MEASPRHRAMSERHAKLDLEIAKDGASPFSDDLEVARKKKIKLSLKDGIEGMNRSGEVT